MKTLLFRLPDCTTRAVTVEDANDCYQKLSSEISTPDVRIVLNGEDVHDLTWDDVPEMALLEVEVEVLGGKGGFGSLLRIAAAQKKHFNNFDSSRDSNGRRLRDIKNQLRLEEFIKKKRVEKRLLDEEMAQLKKQQENLPTDTSLPLRLEAEESYKEKLSTWQQNLDSTIRRGSILRKTTKRRVNPEQNDEVKQEIADQEEEVLGKRKALNQKGLDKSHQAKVFTTLPSEENVPVEHYFLPKRRPKEDITHDNEPNVGPQLPANANSTQTYPPIELGEIKSLDELIAMHPEHLKQELKRLGLKCGGAPKDRAQRLWDIKQNPANLFSQKYLSK